MTVVYSRAEVIADATIHGVGLIAGVAATVLLMWVVSLQDDVVRVFACAVYGFGLLTMFGLSAAYHLETRPGLKEILRRLDHAGIFVMIAGTYTPLALVKIHDPWGITLFCVVWAITLFGIVLKLRYPRRFERLSIGLYLLQGWLVVLAVMPLLDVISISGVILIGVGALLYTVGVVFHLSTRLAFHNAIWHGLVLLAAACHFAVVLADVALPTVTR